MVGPNDKPFTAKDFQQAQDPTYVPVQVTNPATDPFQRRMVGYARHGNTPFDVPFISQIVPGFYQGGCADGLVLPREIEYVVSLYKWGRYTQHEGVKGFREVTMYDSADEPDRDNVVELATLVNDFRAKGNTLVHCQAGLNRSGLIAGAALVLSGYTPEDAIKTLRESRSPAVLCNRTFEEWLLRWK